MKCSIGQAGRGAGDLMQLGLSGRVVVVTGGSTGIGAALAVAYGREGARVVITFRTNQTGAMRTAAEVERAGGQATAVPFDLAAPDSARDLVHTVIDRWGQLDVLVANAVAWPRRAPDNRFEHADPSSWQAALRTNVEGTFALVHAVVPHMRAAGWGRILFISTGLAEEGMPGGESYTATKAALHGLSRSLAWDFGRDGILVNVLAAGLTLTDRNLANLPAHVRESVAARTPLGQLSRPDEVVAPALFLTAEANTSITGEVIREGSSTGRSAHSP